MEILFTAFLFGIFAGFMPGPILTSGFMTIIKNPNGLRYVLLFPIILGAIEIIIGLTITQLGSLFFTNTILIIITILGIINILNIAYDIFKTRKTFSLFSNNENYSSISYKQVSIMTLFNGPLYIFWITVGMPLVLNAKNEIGNGDIFFVFSMVLGVSISTVLLFLVMHKYRYFFHNEKVMRNIPFVISAFFIFMGLQMMSTLFSLL